MWVRVRQSAARRSACAHARSIELTSRRAAALQLWLAAALYLMSTSVYIFYLNPKECFMEFVVTDSIEEKLGGKAKNLVKPLGWTAITLFAIAWGMQIIYHKWVDRRLARYNHILAAGGGLDEHRRPEGGEDGDADTGKAIALNKTRQIV